MTCPPDLTELRDHQEYCKKIAMKTGTHTQVPVPMTITGSRLYVVECRERLISATQLSLSSQVPDFCLQNQN